MLIAWFVFFRVGGNWFGINRVEVIWVGMIWLKPYFRILVFGNSVASKLFTYRCTILWWRYPIDKIKYPPKGFEDVKPPQTGTLWEVASNSSMWVHPDGVITTPPDYSPSNTSTTIQTVKGDFTITISPSGNVSGSLVVLYDGWFTHRIVRYHYSTPGGLKAAYHNYSRHRRLIYERQQSIFHPSVVGVSQLIFHQFLKGIPPKWRGQ